MSRNVFINLPVWNVRKSTNFYLNLGFAVIPHFCDENAACIAISEAIFVMLLTHKRFADFTPLPICDATQRTEVLAALSCEERDEVDRLATQACQAGVRETGDPLDYGFMYGRSVQDLDGHILELIWMDPASIPQEASAS